MPRLSLADEGELLFYDARLSSDGWYSCHSCHTDGHSNGQRSDTFGDGYRGEPKRVLSLLGSAETRPWAWNGSVPTLEAQIRKSIETTMRGDSPTEAQVQAIAAYLMTLTPPPSITAARNDPPVDPNSLIPRGQQVFTQLGCADCHVPPLYTSSSTYDVGLVDGDDQRKFNPPSLRGLVHQSRLLHDGSATTLKAALQIHPYGEPTELPEDAWSALEAFLHSL
jgi:cytochrome c peroxidase